MSDEQKQSWAHLAARRLIEKAGQDPDEKIINLPGKAVDLLAAKLTDLDEMMEAITQAKLDVENGLPR